MTYIVAEAAAAHNIDIIPVPAGLSSLYQPLDVQAKGNLMLKEDARRQWMQGTVDGKENTDTRAGAAERMSSAYTRLKRSTIIDSFEQAVPGLQLPR